MKKIVLYSIFVSSVCTGCVPEPCKSCTDQLPPTAEPPSSQQPHAKMDLVPLDQVTHSAVSSGSWSTPSTWNTGSVPQAGSRVHIPEGLSVEIDGVNQEPIKTVRIDGTLSFATNSDTEFKVDTLVSSRSGRLIMGSPEAPIAKDVVAKLTFTDDGPIDRNWDPNLVSRGALLHGKTTIFGASKKPYSAVSTFPRAGDRSVTLKQAPSGWEIGDTIVIAGTDPKVPTSDEKVSITDIDGKVISFYPPLLNDHVPPRNDLELHVANLTRNVRLSSESSAIKRRGHLMFVHNNNANINFAAFNKLGRVDKTIEYDDFSFPDLDPNLKAIALGGDNVRGRYAVHFHKGGTDKSGSPAQVRGNVVTQSAGWGFVNHSSYVNFSDNVTYDVVGAAYYTEAGDEIGAFINNIAIRTVNSDVTLIGNPEHDAPDVREGRQDYGFQGDGFWFHGPNVRVEGNIVSGTSGHAYIWWPEGLLEAGSDRSVAKVFHDTANVPNGHLIGPAGTRMQIMDVPIGSFVGNKAYSVARGIQIFYLHTEFFGDGLHVEDGTINPPEAYDAQLRSTLKDSTIWNVGFEAVAIPYVNRVTLENLRLVGNGLPNTVGVNVAHFENLIGLELKNLVVEDFAVGLKVTTEGEVTIEGGSLSNDVDTQWVIPVEE